MINIAICDDEKPFQEKMRKIIALYMERKEVEFSISTFGNGRDLLKILLLSVPYRGRLFFSFFLEKVFHHRI